jgi:hypothetical protein
MGGIKTIHGSGGMSEFPSDLGENREKGEKEDKN